MRLSEKSFTSVADPQRDETAGGATNFKFPRKPNPLDGCPTFAPAQPGHYVG